MNKHTIAALLLVLAGAVWAQQESRSGPSAPEDTEIVVPDLVLEVEELEVKQVTAVLPDAGELALGQVSIPLPGADELSVDDEAFTVPLPGATATDEATSVFTSGGLGAGSANHVVGELEVYKLGVDPRFRLRFAHEGLDGYQFRQAGTGYFSRENTIDGWFAAGNETVASDIEAAFTDDVIGMQGTGDSFSAGLRATSVDARVTVTPDPLIAIAGLLDGSIASRILSSSGAGEPPREQEISVTPGAEARFSIRTIDIVVETSYFLRYLTSERVPVAQSVDALAGLDAELPEAITLGVRAGVFWEPGERLGYPWRLSVGKLFGDALEVGLSGGYRYERLTLADTWERWPIAGLESDTATDELATDVQWFGELDLRWSGASGLTLTGGVDFAAHEAALDIEPFETVDEEFPLVQRPMLSLEAAAAASWRPVQRVQFQAGWNGSLLESATGVPTSSVLTSIRMSDASERFSASAEARTGFYPEVAMPMVGLSGSFAPSDEIEFTIELSDLLAPLLEEGRPSIGAVGSEDFPFIEPGFRASIFTRISL